MIDLPPPPKLLFDPPSIIRPVDEALLAGVDRKLKTFGLDQAVRRALLAETCKIVRDLPPDRKPFLHDVRRHLSKPELASMLINPFVLGSGGGGGGSDPNFANVVLLLGFEGTNGATTTTDESPAAHSLTFNGNAQISTAQFKYGVSSLALDTSGDYLSSADSLDWRLAASNSDTYTIEFWIRPHGTVSGSPIMGQAPGSGNFAWYIDLTITATPTYALTFNSSANGSGFSSIGIGSNTLPLDTWHFIAISKNSSGKIRTWVNGTFGNSTTPADSSIFNSTGALEIGRSFFTANLNAWLDEIRITKGVCRYDTDGSITVPTAAFPRS